MTSEHLKELTEFEAASIQVFEKPAPGSWTEAFGLDTGPVSFKDSHDPEFYELEKEAVFRRSWLNLGRMEQLPRPGSYFTRELEFLGVSILVVRGMDDQIRAFHNVCSHRGNKLVWDEYPNKESKGNCRQFACKYHGWRYGLDGEIAYVHNAREFFDLEAEELALPKIHCDVLAGFVWINLEETPRQTLREYLGPEVCKLESYPFDKMNQTYVWESEIESNWKLYADAFQEIYHIPYLHGKMANPALAATGIDKVPMMCPQFATFGKHRGMSTVGPYGNLAALGAHNPVDKLFGANMLGTFQVPDVGPLGDGVNPGRIEPWGGDSWQIYPNLAVVVWNRNAFTTYQYWPLSPTRHRFVCTMNYVKPTSVRERLAQEHAAMMFSNGVLQDAATLEATQVGVSSGARDRFFIGDQEPLVRHFHRVIQNDVDVYRRELEAAGNGKGTSGL